MLGRRCAINGAVKRSIEARGGMWLTDAKTRVVKHVCQRLWRRALWPR